MIISLILMLVLGVQSCAVAVGGSVVKSLGSNQGEKMSGQTLSGGGGLGVFAALLWLVAAAFVLNKPKASMWLFVAAGVVCLLGGGSGFSDLFIWAGLSFVFALLSWRGTKEKETKDAEERAKYQADVQAAAVQQRPPAG